MGLRRPWTQSQTSGSTTIVTIIRQGVGFGIYLLVRLGFPSSSLRGNGVKATYDELWPLILQFSLMCLPEIIAPPPPIHYEE